MRKLGRSWLLLAGVPLLNACGAAQPSAPEAALPAAATAEGDAAVSARGWGPATPPFQLEVVLRGDTGFGLVRFRQPNDGTKVIHLDTWVRDLLPDTAYLLQRAVDGPPTLPVDGVCSSQGWLTLGKGLVPQDLLTDAGGTAREALWRDVSAVTTGARFDIHFRVVEKATGAVALESDCSQYVVEGD